jgi:hypothetical protein
MPLKCHFLLAHSSGNLAHLPHFGIFNNIGNEKSEYSDWLRMQEHYFCRNKIFKLLKRVKKPITVPG